MTAHDSIIEQAAAWHFASAGDDMDWDGFTVWLEADPRHRIAYDEIARTDALVARHASVLLQQDDAPALPDQGKGAWKRWVGGAMAACLVAVVAVSQLQQAAPVSYTTDAQARRIALDDGSVVMLAPHSKLSVGGADQDQLALSGGAWFDIRHDPSRTMEISAGPVTVTDIGSRFDVQASSGTVRVAMEDGQVRVEAKQFSSPVNLEAGQALYYDTASDRPRVLAMRPQSAGSWRNGTLDYQRMPLSLVAADLERYAGVRIAVPEGLRSRTFSGSIAIGDGKSAVRDLGLLMGLEIRSEPGRFSIEPGGS